MEEITKKDKYIIYNQDYKVLVFISTTATGHKHVSIPGVITQGYNEIDSTGEFYKNIKTLLIKEEPCFLNQVVLENSFYKSVNNKFKKIMLQLIRNYYSYYKEFKQEDYEEIFKLSYNKNIEPYFLEISELKGLISNRNNSDATYNLDVYMKESLEELDKKLKFIKY